MIDELKTFESKEITISVSYKNEALKEVIEYDIFEQNIGLIMNSIPTFEAEDLKETLYSLKKLVYLFGDENLYDIHKCVVLMSENEKMESISSTSFDISDMLGLQLTLCDFDPEGDFESKKMIIEHYETLTHIFNIEMKIEQKVANPIRELSNMKFILQVAPFEKHLNTDSYRNLISSKIQDFLLTTTKHPKLLVPFALAEVSTKD